MPLQPKVTQDLAQDPTVPTVPTVVTPIQSSREIVDQG